MSGDHSHGPAAPVGAVPAGTACELHRDHRPRPLTLVQHHAWPLGMDGPDVADNRHWCCDTGHRNVHVYLAWLVFGQPKGDPEPHAARSEKALARKGFDAWDAAGRPGNPHAAYALAGIPHPADPASEPPA